MNIIKRNYSGKCHTSTIITHDKKRKTTEKKLVNQIEMGKKCSNRKMQDTRKKKKNGMKYAIWQMVNKTSKCWYMNFVLRNRPRYCGSSIFCSLHTNHKLSTAKHFIQILRTYEYSIYAKRVSLVFRCWLLQIVLFVSFIFYSIFADFIFILGRIFLVVLVSAN